MTQTNQHEVCAERFGRIVEAQAEQSTTIRDMSKSLSKVERKVFNGFGERIDSIDHKVDKVYDILTNGHKKGGKQAWRFGWTLLAAFAVVVLGIGALAVMVMIYGPETVGAFVGAILERIIG